jgi:hypothetical protein
MLTREASNALLGRAGTVLAAGRGGSWHLSRLEG